MVNITKLIFTEGLLLAKDWAEAFFLSHIILINLYPILWLYSPKNAGKEIEFHGG